MQFGRAASRRLRLRSRRAMPFGAAARSLHHPRSGYACSRVVPLLSLSLRSQIKNTKKNMDLTKAQIEHIIDYKILVDAYGDAEASMGWQTYMGDNMFYPFEAEYLLKRPNNKSEWRKIKVVGNIYDDDDDTYFNGSDYYVTIEVEDLVFPAKLSKLKNIVADIDTLRTIQIWKSQR
jgi:hypothetical protein